MDLVCISWPDDPNTVSLNILFKKVKNTLIYSSGMHLTAVTFITQLGGMLLKFNPYMFLYLSPSYTVTGDKWPSRGWFYSMKKKTFSVNSEQVLWVKAHVTPSWEYSLREAKWCSVHD